jgi:hypothetical protein
MSMRIYDSNWTQPEYVANKIVSSEASTNPVSNIYDYSRRTRTWRSGGYWNVLSGENTIVFRESIGVDLTATIAVAEYSTTASFLTAIKTALDASGASTYTVSLHTDGRIKILSDLSGGGGVFQIRWTSATDFGDLIGFDTSAVDTGAAFYIADLLRINSEEFIEWDLGIASNPTGFFLIADRNKPLNISQSATVKLQGNWTNNWAAPVVEITIPLKDYILAYENESGFYSGGLRYWRVSFDDVDNASQYLEFGFVYLGDHYASDRGCPAFPLGNSYDDRSAVVFSESGQMFGQNKPITQRFDLNWEGLTKLGLEALDSFFHDQGVFKPFFISMDPNEAFSTDSETWVRYVAFNSTPASRLVSPNNWSMSWDLREAL